MTRMFHGFLADSEMASGLNQYLEDSASLVQHGWMIGGAVCIALVWCSYPVIKRRRDAQRRAAAKAAAPRPKSVFVELCDRHRLDKDDRQLLELAAREGGLESPSVLFVAPAGLRSLANTQPEHAERCETLESHLFAQFEPVGV